MGQFKNGVGTLEILKQELNMVLWGSIDSIFLMQKRIRHLMLSLNMRKICRDKIKDHTKYIHSLMLHVFL